MPLPVSVNVGPVKRAPRRVRAVNKGATMFVYVAGQTRKAFREVSDRCFTPPRDNQQVIDKMASAANVP